MTHNVYDPTRLVPSSLLWSSGHSQCIFLNIVPPAQRNRHDGMHRLMARSVDKEEGLGLEWLKNSSLPLSLPLPTSPTQATTCMSLSTVLNCCPVHNDFSGK